MQEEWVKWVPLPSVTNKYDIISESLGNNSLIILLSSVTDGKKSISITFDDSLCAYRSSNETFRLALLNDLAERYGNDFYVGTFFKVARSTYLKSFLESTSHVANSKKLTHFAFISANSVLDVIAECEPQAQVIAT